MAPEPGDEQPPRDTFAARLAAALGLPEERVAAALRQAALTPSQLANAARAGLDDERVRDLAKLLRVDPARLAAAVIDAAGEWVRLQGTAAEGFAAAARGAADEAVSIGLEIVGETIPRIVSQVLAVFAAAGVVFVALGALALVDAPLFRQLLTYIAGLALIITGVLLFALAWKVHEATATLRTVAKIAKKWRERRAAGEAAKA